jgi:hypothetical protein
LFDCCLCVLVPLRVVSPYLPRPSTLCCLLIVDLICCHQ